MKSRPLLSSRETPSEDSAKATPKSLAQGGGFPLDFKEGFFSPGGVGQRNSSAGNGRIPEASGAPGVFGQGSGTGWDFGMSQSLRIPPASGYSVVLPLTGIQILNFPKAAGSQGNGRDIPGIPGATPGWDPAHSLSTFPAASQAPRPLPGLFPAPILTQELKGSGNVTPHPHPRADPGFFGIKRVLEKQGWGENRRKNPKGGKSRGWMR